MDVTDWKANLCIIVCKLAKSRRQRPMKRPIKYKRFYPIKKSPKTYDCLLALAAALRFAPTPSLRLLFTTLYFVEGRPSALVSSLATFLRLPRFPQVVFSFRIGLISSKKDAADCENSVLTVDEQCETYLA
ncbi:hypothetical protein TNCV_2629041 [Trichonephila clavipes]|uniref:Uncharacterized protein n=1 Tax=Trichonephila clavipes TaxID=2585209 RepID=A0A8X6SF41_TRICX|nr:hypothetical protein TNCV_2629041 [Trichonephila clavipes]